MVGKCATVSAMCRVSHSGQTPLPDGTCDILGLCLPRQNLNKSGKNNNQWLSNVQLYK
jgi:hypothetical protein